MDLDAPPGTALVSPADGTVSFAGKVGGKDVVAIRHDEGFVTSYEPVTTTRKVGEDLHEGEEFGRVGGESEHCGGSCVHWGLRRDGAYADPVPLTEARRIGLKPTS